MSTKRKDNEKIILVEDKFKKSHQMTDVRGLLPLAQYRTENLIAKYVQQFNLPFDEYIANKQDMNFCIPLKVVKDWYPDRKSWKRDLESAVDQLMSTKVEIRYQEGGWTKGWLIGQASLLNDGLHLKFNPDVMQAYLIQKEGYSLLDYSTMRFIDNRAAYVFYELCCKWRRAGYFEFTPSQMTERFQVKYDANKLSDRIIKPAYDKLKDLYESGKSDICFEVEANRSGRGRGRGVVSWKFIIVTKDIEQRKVKDQKEYLAGINLFFERELPTKSLIIMEQVKQMPFESLWELHIRIEKLKAGELSTKQDRVRYICSILLHGFGINPNMVPKAEDLFKIPEKKDKKSTQKKDLKNNSIPELFPADTIESGFSEPAKWKLFIETLKSLIEEDKFKMWILPIIPLSFHTDKNLLLLKVPSKFFYEYIEDNFIHQLSEARDAAFPKCNIRYIIAN